MIEENALSPKRILFILLSLFVMLAGVLFLGLFNKLLTDEIITVEAIVLAFFLILSVGLISKRHNGRFLFNATSYGVFFLFTLLSVGVMIGSSFLPEFAKPLMLIPFMYCMTTDGTVAIGFSILINFICCYFGNQSLYEFAAYCFIGALFLLIYEQLRNKKNLFFTSLIIFCINLFVPCIFYYLTYFEIKNTVFIWCGGVALAQAVLISVFHGILIRPMLAERHSLYSIMLMDEYELVRVIKKYSMFEYAHAIKVARLSRIIASIVECDEEVAAAAGFYYRIGKMEGEPFIENGVKIASEHGFPIEVIQILSEYGGELRPISSRESAIVHMTNAVITKLEQLGNEHIAGEWNQDIVVYQTLNEASQSGLYDESGLSMNQFLRAREVLLKEDLQSDL